MESCRRRTRREVGRIVVDGDLGDLVTGRHQDGAPRLGDRRTQGTPADRHAEEPGEPVRLVGARALRGGDGDPRSGRRCRTPAERLGDRRRAMRFPETRARGAASFPPVGPGAGRGSSIRGPRARWQRGRRRRSSRGCPRRRPVPFAAEGGRDGVDPSVEQRLAALGCSHRDPRRSGRVVRVRGGPSRHGRPRGRALAVALPRGPRAPTGRTTERSRPSRACAGSRSAPPRCVGRRTVHAYAGRGRAVRRDRRGALRSEPGRRVR